MVVPEGMAGIQVDYIFMSAEYEEYIGDSYNDKFYIFLEGEQSTGETQLINTTLCRDPENYSDTVDENGDPSVISPSTRRSVSFCTPRSIQSNRTDSIAALTDISGTGPYVRNRSSIPRKGGRKMEAAPVGFRPLARGPGRYHHPDLPHSRYLRQFVRFPHHPRQFQVPSGDGATVTGETTKGGSSGAPGEGENPRGRGWRGARL